MNHNQSTYRPEIDGLRAVSVLAILLFHAGFEWASGGFVGVDVFFVISGYLITRIIWNDLASGQFKFSNFYIRRIKRLFPALVFTLLVVLLAGYWLFAPTDLERLGQSLQYAVVSLSNFFFWQEAGYFNEDSTFKPLLHTWSLATEEQYYLLWPALLYAIAKVNKKGALVVVLLAASVISLWLNHRYLETQPSTAFFLLPFRVFEFAIGGLCVVLYEHKQRHQAWYEVAVLLGLAMIVWAVFKFDQNTAFPGFAALLPCLGAALVIISHPSKVGRYILSTRGMLLIGVTSYSIYLIHWPVLVFYKYWHFTPISLTVTLGLLAVSIAAGYLMWRFVEQPFRPVKAGFNKTQFWFKFLAAVVLVWGLGLLTQKNQGWPHRYPAEFFMTAEEIDTNRTRYWEYFGEENKNTVVDPNQKNLVVMGNSHAVDLVYALRENGMEANLTYFNSWHECYNFGTPLLEKDRKGCDNRLRRHLKHPAWKQADAIYLHDHWPKLDVKDLQQRLLEIRAISQAPIYVFGPKMSYHKRVPDIILSHLRMASINEFAKQFSDQLYLKNLNRTVKARLAKMGSQNISYIDVLAIQCGAEIDQCEVVSSADHQFLYFDYSHFTLQGAKEFGAKLKQAHPELF